MEKILSEPAPGGKTLTPCWMRETTCSCGCHGVGRRASGIAFYAVRRSIAGTIVEEWIEVRRVVVEPAPRRTTVFGAPGRKAQRAG